MNLQDATNLLRSGETVFPEKQNWADLGCGNGIFTRALAHLLQPGSIIYAVDINRALLNQVPGKYNGLIIEKIAGDFIKDNLRIENLDGILMANTLHFVEDKHGFLNNIVKYLKPAHNFIVLEYDIEKSNQWVPYPVSFSSLKNIFNNAGYNLVSKLKEHPSVYQNGNIYSAIARKILPVSTNRFV